MRNRLSSLCLAVAVCATWTSSEIARAGDSTTEAPDITKSREEFVKGAELVRHARWGEALSAFERSATLHPHATTTFNIGACERALGEYTRARMTFGRALSENDAQQQTELNPTLVSNIHAFVEELDGLLASANVSLVPSTASIAVDGRPLLVVDPNVSPMILFAGVRAAGPGEPSPAAAFRVRLNPGAHVFTLARRGYADVVINRTFLPGSSVDLPILMDRLPATIHVASTEPASIVTIDGDDVGATPATISRPAGQHRLVVRKSGFIKYETTVDARAGEEVNLSANLEKEKPALTQRWWFWTGIGVVVIGAATATYFATRKDPERPPVDGGGLGWAIPLR